MLHICLFQRIFKNGFGLGDLKFQILQASGANGVAYSLKLSSSRCYSRQYNRSRRGRAKRGRGAHTRSSRQPQACSRRCARSALSRRTLVFLFSSVSVPKKKSKLAERMRGLAWQIWERQNDFFCYTLFFVNKFGALRRQSVRTLLPSEYLEDVVDCVYVLVSE